MRSIVAETTEATAAADAPAETCRRVFDSIRTMTGPILEAAGASLVCTCDSVSTWIVRSGQCSCAFVPAPFDVEAIHIACGAGRRRAQLELNGLDSQPWSLTVCFHRQAEWIPAAVAAIVNALVHEAEQKAVENSLLEELSLSWESLEAIYEISSDMQWMGQPGKLLERIASRAARARENCEATFWLECDGVLEPVASTDETAKRHGSMAAPGLREIVARRTGVAMNHRDEIAAIDGLSPVFNGATNLAIAPIATRQGLVGALTVWSTAGVADFESRAIRLFEALALQAAMVIENDNLRRATIESERLRSEIEIGSKIQRLLLSQPPPADLPGVCAAAVSIASRHIDGDFFDFVAHEGPRFDVLVGDVMGKGVPAAILGAATKNSVLRALSAETRSSLEKPSRCPADILAAVQRDMSPRLMELESFVTMCYARFDTAASGVEIIDCGHASPIHFHRVDGSSEFLRGENLPLGVLANEDYRPVFEAFDPGDVFVFYSDGLTEAASSDGELFGEMRLAACVEANSSLEPDELIGAIRAAIDAFSDSAAYGDDLTIVVVRINPRESSPSFAEVQCSSRTSELGRAREFVRDFCIARIRDVDEVWLAQLELAVNETLANVIEHGFDEQPDGHVIVQAEHEPNSVTVVVSYEGPDFDPAGVAPPSFEGDRDGGFGLFIIEQSVDEVAYTNDGRGRNIVRLVKRYGDGRREPSAE